MNCASSALAYGVQLELYNSELNEAFNFNRILIGKNWSPKNNQENKFKRKPKKADSSLTQILHSISQTSTKSGADGHPVQKNT